MTIMHRKAAFRGHPLHVDGLRPGLARNDAVPGMVEVLAKINEVHRNFEAFKSKNDEQIAALKAGRDDVVRREEVDRINEAVSRASNELKDMAQQVAAVRTAPTDKPGQTVEAAAHARAFNGFIRKGVDNGLNDLAVKAALSTDSDPDGGYVVPEELDATIARVMEKTSAMRRLSTVQSVGAATYKKIINLGGAGSGWVGEKQARPQTNTPQLAEIVIPTMEVYAMPAATQATLDDARTDIEKWLSGELGLAFVAQEADAFIQGNGVVKPRGFLSYNFAASSAASPSAWEKIGFTKTGANGAFAADPNGGDALLDLIYSLKAEYRAEAAFIMNSASTNRLRKLKDSDGNYLWQPRLAEGEPDRLLGYRVETDDYMPDFATDAYPIAFGDFKRGYLITDRFGIRLVRDPYTNKPYVMFYTTKRVGGGVVDFHAIKCLKASA